MLYFERKIVMDMKNKGRKMSLLMGVTMSFVLSLIGNLSSGRFTLKGFLTSFLISFVIGLVLGSIVPMKRISDSLLKKTGCRPGSVKARLLESLVPSLVFSPIMTFIMVYIAYSQATAHGAQLNFLPMLLRSEIISIVCAYILSFIITPVYMKMIFKDTAG